MTSWKTAITDKCCSTCLHPHAYYRIQETLWVATLPTLIIVYLAMAMLSDFCLCHGLDDSYQILASFCTITCGDSHITYTNSHALLPQVVASLVIHNPSPYL